jgi:copper chaperone NosL
MWTLRLVIVAFPLLAAACGAKAMGPPEIVVDRTACSHCGMFVSEPIFAAAYQLRGNDPRVFDDIGCMLNALRAETVSPINVWVRDAAGAGWIDAGEATFVASPNVRTPMNGGFIAYAEVTAAETAATTSGGAVVRSFEALLNQKGDAR